MSGAGGGSFAQAWGAAADTFGRMQQRQLWQGMGAYERHKRLMHDLATLYRGAGGGGDAAGGVGQQPPQLPLPAKTDYDVLREHHRFIRNEEDDAQDSWEVRLARRYYNKLFKEYAVADLSRHKEGRVGLRWRTQKEVVSGKGQFSCGARGCDERRGLASFEVPFSYEEAGQRRQALVKLRVCPTHAYQLNYRKHKEAEEAGARRRERRQQRRERQQQRESRGNDAASEEEEQERARAGKRRRSSEGKGKREKAKEAKPGAEQRERHSSKRSRRNVSDGTSSEEDAEASSGSSSDEGGPRRRQGRSSGDKLQHVGSTAAARAAEPGSASREGDEEFEAFLRGLMD